MPKKRDVNGASQCSSFHSQATRSAPHGQSPVTLHRTSVVDGPVARARLRTKKSVAELVTTR